jgi:exodeoxyribonuclease VII large subunit
VRSLYAGGVKAEAIDYGDRRVYTVASFNRGVAGWLSRLPTVWVEGEVTELRRQQAWQSIFLTLKDPVDGACLPVSMPRSRFDALRLELRDGERVHVFGRPELFEARGDFRLRALSIERFGLGEHLARLERLKEKLAAEGLFALDRKRPLPRVPSRIGLVTGNDAAAKRDVVATIAGRFPAARVLVAEVYVQGPRAPGAIVEAIGRLCDQPDVDVVVLARGGGSFEDLLPFSDERLVRAVATCPVPVVSAIGHEQDSPLCDLAADVRASTPTAAAKLVVPDHGELTARLERDRSALERSARRTVHRHDERLASAHGRLRRAPGLAVERHARRLAAAHERLRRAPELALERRSARLEQTAGRLRALSPRATLQRGYAIVRTGGKVLRSSAGVEPGAVVDVELAEGGLGARVEETRP